MNGALLAIAALTASVWLLLLVTRRPMTIATVAFVVAFVAQTEVGLNNPAVSRIPLALLFGLAALFALGERANPALGMPHGGSGAVRAEVLFIVGLLAGSLAVTTSMATSLEALAGAAAALFVGVTLGRFVPTAAILDRLFLAAAAMTLASVASLAVLGSAWEAGRLRGVFENANGLGGATMIAMAVAPKRLVWFAVPVLGAVLVASGSRASGMGFVIAALLRIEWRPSTRMGAFVVAPMVLGAVLLLAASAFSQDVDSVEQATAVADPTDSTGSIDDAEILRTRDNRTAQWEQGLVDIADNMPIGSGFGTAAFEYSNSAITLAVQVGALSVPIFLVTARVVARSVRHHDRRVRALLIAMVAHSMFEGWMFAFGSFLAIVFWTVMVSASTDYLRRSEEPSIDLQGFVTTPASRR